MYRATVPGSARCHFIFGVPGKARLMRVFRITMMKCMSLQVLAAALLLGSLDRVPSWGQQVSSAVLEPAPGQTLTEVARSEKHPEMHGAIDESLKAAHTKFADLKEGKNADYIPALAEVDSDLFGIAVVTVDGKVHAIGDADYEFAIESIAKVFAYALALSQSKGDAIADLIGVDATGRPFNSIEAVAYKRGAEQNPFVNAGAIATVGLIDGDTFQQKWGSIMGVHEAFAGRKLKVNEVVYESEAATNQSNQAIAKLMLAYGKMEGDTEMITDVYTRECSINVSAKDLATMAATLANGGTNPVTHKEVLQPENVPKVLAVMATAGLYDDSGVWLYHVGLPAKSGVGGGIIAVAPGKFGIAAFSPPLDEAGNSVRAQKAIEMIVNRLGANPYISKPAK